MSKVKITLSSLIIITLLLVGTGIWYQQQDNGVKKTAAKVPAVSIKFLQPQIVAKTVLSYGRIVSPNSVQIKAQMDGVITSLDFKPGEYLHKGQEIFSLHASDTTSQLTNLKAKTESSQQIFLRYKKMNQLSHGAVAASTVQTARLQYEQDLAAYKQAMALNVNVAPINGVITDTSHAIGDYVSIGDVIASMVDKQSVQLQYQLPGQYASQVKIGQAVYFSPNAKQRGYLAHVSYIAPQLNSSNQSIDLRAVFAEKIPMLTNDFSTVEQVLNAHDKTLAISQGLVQSDAQGFFVYLLENSKVTKRYFQAGSVTKQGVVIVLSGLKAGDQLITTDPSILTPQEIVKVNAK